MLRPLPHDTLTLLRPALPLFPQPPQEHLPNLISIIMYNRDALEQRKPCCTYDPGVKVTYFVTQVDAHHHLVLLFASHKRITDSPVVEFLTMMRHSLSFRPWQAMSRR